MAATEECFLDRDRDRRKAERFALAGTVQWDGGRGLTRNVSRTGAYFETGRPPAPGETVAMTLVLASDRDGETLRLSCRGRVLRAGPLGPGRWGVAVEFSDHAFQPPRRHPSPEGGMVRDRSTDDGI